MLEYIAMHTKLPYAALGQGPGQRSLEGVLLNIVVVLLEEQRVHKELLILSLSHSYVGFIVRKLVIGVVAYQNYHDQCMQVWYAKNYDVRMCKQGAGIFTNHKPSVWIAQLAFEVMQLIFTVRAYND